MLEEIFTYIVVGVMVATPIAILLYLNYKFING